MACRSTRTARRDGARDIAMFRAGQSIVISERRRLDRALRPSSCRASQHRYLRTTRPPRRLARRTRSISAAVAPRRSDSDRLTIVGGHHGERGHEGGGGAAAKRSGACGRYLFDQAAGSRGARPRKRRPAAGVTVGSLAGRRAGARPWRRRSRRSRACASGAAVQGMPVSASPRTRCAVASPPPSRSGRASLRG